MKSLALVVGLMLSFGGVSGQENYNVRRGDREAIISTEAERERLYDGTFHFSPAVKAGDFVFLSGVVAGAWQGDVLDRAGFKAAVRAAFAAIGRTLENAGSGFDGVVHMRTFHVFDSPFIGIPKVEQFEVIAEVRQELIPEPHAAWTGVGSTELLPDRGIVEIEVVAFAPSDG